MTFTAAKLTREVNINELRELLSLMENQETTDQFTNTALSIDGEYAHIDCEVDEDGNVLLF